jgi:ubiquitin C-terminal hydrolase
MKEHAEAEGIPLSREPGLTYLFNGSNMCFINCVLQALSQTPGFVNKFLDDGILELMHPVVSHTADGRLTLGLGEVLKRMWLGRQKLVNATEFKALLTQAHAGYDNDDQQDVREFLLDLMLSVLQSTRMFPFKEQVWNVPTVCPFPVVSLADRKFRNALLSQKGLSPFAADFVGQLCVTFTRHQCFHLKHYYENFLTLELELPSKGTSRTLEQLFKDNIVSPVLYPAMRCG